MEIDRPGVDDEALSRRKLPPPQGGPSRDHVVLLAFYSAMGILIYLSVALFDSLYAPRLPQDVGWCVAFYETDEGTYCAKYGTPLEEAKDLLNARAERRRVWFVDGVLGLAATAGGLFTFLTYGARRRAWIDRSRVATVVTGALLGFLWSGLVAAALGVVAPAPARWLPRFLAQQHEASLAHRMELAQKLAARIGER